MDTISIETSIPKDKLDEIIRFRDEFFIEMDSSDIKYFALYFLLECIKRGLVEVK